MGKGGRVKGCKKTEGLRDGKRGKVKGWEKGKRVRG